MRPANPLADAAQVLLDRLRDGRAAGRGSGGDGRAGPRSPREAAARSIRLAGHRVGAARRGATTSPPGSATAGSSSSISTPTTGWSPAASAALANRTAP